MISLHFLPINLDTYKIAFDSCCFLVVHVITLLVTFVANRLLATFVANRLLDSNDGLIGEVFILEHCTASLARNAFGRTSTASTARWGNVLNESSSKVRPKVSGNMK